MKTALALGFFMALSLVLSFTWFRGVTRPRGPSNRATSEWQWSETANPTDASIPTPSSDNSTAVNPIVSPSSAVAEAHSGEPRLAEVLQVATAGPKVEGFPETVIVREGNSRHSLTYTGKFIRKRWFLHLYEIASYIEAPQNGSTDNLLDALLRDGTRRVYLLRFLKPLPGSQIHGAIEEEIALTFTDVDMPRLRPNIDNFTRPFGNGSNTGDMVYLVWLPGGRSFSSFGDPQNVSLIARDVPLARAIWRIWAGENSGPERAGLVRRFASE